MKRYWSYLKYVLRHKLYVLLEGRKLGLPLLMLIFHDWDKFLPFMFISYAKTFYKADGTSQYDENIDFAVAWMQHQHRNKHHWQYWLKYKDFPIRLTNEIVVWDDATVDRIIEYDTVRGPVKELQALEQEFITADVMSNQHRIEMIADWLGVGRTLGTDTYEWWKNNRDRIILHPVTRWGVEQAFWTLYELPNIKDNFYFHKDTKIIHPSEFEE